MNAATRRVALCLISLVLAACSSKFQDLTAQDTRCTAQSNAGFDQFSVCIKKSLTEAHKESSVRGTRGNSAVSAMNQQNSEDGLLKSFIQNLDIIRSQLKSGTIDDAEAYRRYQVLQQEYAQLEYQENQRAQAIGAAILIGAAVYATCKDGGCGGGGGGGGGEINSNQGCCSWHGGVAACSSGRLMCIDGTLSPTCGC